MKAIFFSIILGLGAMELASAQTAPTANTNALTVAPKPPVLSVNPNALTPADWQEIRTAQQEAMKANPDLLKEAAQLSQKMRDFQHKLNRAILQADPSVAPVVERIENGPAPRLIHPPSGPAAAPNNTPLPPSASSH